MPGNSAPYIGPRPFSYDNKSFFFGRDEEAVELISLIISHTVVVLYAQSGAGKTSLVNAQIIPSLEEKQIETLGPARVSGIIPPELKDKIDNVFVYNTLTSLQDNGDPLAFANKTLTRFLAERPKRISPTGTLSPLVLIFDQFEEIFTTSPEYWTHREGFFDWLGEALEEAPYLRVLLVLREEYLAGPYQYAHLIPEKMNTRFRLERLRREAALLAITNPIRNTGRVFGEGVADRLVDELLKTRIREESTNGEAKEVVGEFVEPVQLQIVCQNLWNSLPPETKIITSDQVQKSANVDEALKDFYEKSIKGAVTETKSTEGELRNWFDKKLITELGTRGTVFKGQRTTAKLPNKAVDYLEDKYLIRSEFRAGLHWYELTHDRFIKPIKDSNEAWRRRRWSNLITRWKSVVWMQVALLLIIFIAAVIVYSRHLKKDSKEAATLSGLLLNRNPQLSLEKAAEAVNKSHTNEAIQALKDSLHGRLLMVAQGTVTLNLKNPQTIPITFKNPVRSVAFSPSGQFIAAGSEEGKAVVWEIKDGDLKLVTNQIQHDSKATIFAVAFSPDGKYLATGSKDKQVYIWNVDRWTVEARLNKHIDKVRSVEFSHNGKYLVTASEDKKVYLYEVGKWKDAISITEQSPHDGYVQVASFSPDDNRIVTAGRDKHSQIWEIENGKIRHLGVLEDKGDADGSNQMDVVRCALFLDEDRIVTGSEDGQLRIWHYTKNSGKLRWELDRRISAHASFIDSMALSPDRTQLITSSRDATIKIWDVNSWAENQKEDKDLTGHTNEIHDVTISPNGKYIVTGSEDKTVRIFNAGKINDPNNIEDLLILASERKERPLQID